MIISNVENCFLFIVFGDMHSMKDVLNIYAIKFLDISDSIHDFDNERYEITIFDSHSIEDSIIHIET